MTTFVCVIEVWHEDKLGYIAVELTGEHPPKQEDAEEVCDMVRDSYSEYHVIDLVSVLHKGDKLW